MLLDVSKANVFTVSKNLFHCSNFFSKSFLKMIFIEIFFVYFQLKFADTVVLGTV